MKKLLKINLFLFTPSSNKLIFAGVAIIQEARITLGSESTVEEIFIRETESRYRSAMTRVPEVMFPVP